MRCKCGYISFDQQERCPGCKKDTSKLSAELSGVIFKSETPDFLKFGVEEEPAAEDVSVDSVDTASDDEGFDAEAEFDDEEVDIDLGNEDDETAFAEETEEVEFDLSDNATEESDEIEFDLVEEESKEIEFDLSDDIDEENDEIEFDLSDKEEGPADVAADEFGLSLDIGDDDAPAEPEQTGGAADSLDLSGLDLSDLTPPESEVEGKEEKEELSLGGLSLEKSGDADKSAGRGDILSDLDIDDLDLSGPSSAPAGSATGKKLRPSAKTGTALDDFDIDLGEL